MMRYHPTFTILHNQTIQISVKKILNATSEISSQFTIPIERNMELHLYNPSETFPRKL